MVHFAGHLCEELLKAQKTGKNAEKAVGGTSRDALWVKAAAAAAEAAVTGGYGRDQAPLTLAAALTFFIFERHTPKTAPSSKQVAEAAGIRVDALMAAYVEDLLPHMEVRMHVADQCMERAKPSDSHLILIIDVRVLRSFSKLHKPRSYHRKMLLLSSVRLHRSRQIGGRSHLVSGVEPAPVPEQHPQGMLQLPRVSLHRVQTARQPAMPTPRVAKLPMRCPRGRPRRPRAHLLQKLTLIWTWTVLVAPIAA